MAVQRDCQSLFHPHVVKSNCISVVEIKVNSFVEKSCLARENPFAAHRFESIPYRFESGDWESNLRLLSGMRYRAAVVGPHGSGKTTLMLELVEKLSQHGQTVVYHLIAGDSAVRENQFSTCLDAVRNPNTVAVMDGIERFNVWQRQRLFFASAGKPGFIVTVHRSCRLPTWIRCRPSIELMEELLDVLGRADSITTANARRLYAKTRGNLRDVFRGLYDECAHRDS